MMLVLLGSCSLQNFRGAQYSRKQTEFVKLSEEWIFKCVPFDICVPSPKQSPQDLYQEANIDTDYRVIQDSL